MPHERAEYGLQSRLWGLSGRYGSKGDGMSNRFLRKPSPATVIASLALFVSLGGVGYAAATIGSAQIKNNSVRSTDIKNNSVRSTDIKNNDVRGTDVRTGTVNGSDVGNDSLTGADVVESSLGTVPSASNAGRAITANAASTANVANSVSTVRTIGVTTVAEGASPATLATYGPFTLTGACVAATANTVANLNIATTEDNAVANGLTNENDDLDIADSPFNLDSESDAAAGTPNGGSYDATLNAMAPSGRAFAGHIALYSDASAGTSGTCKFHGNIVISG